jgi:hypothetical protein
MPTSKRQPLYSRPLDCFYFIFFAFHIVNFLCIDGQSFWPSWLVPTVLREVKEDYIRDSGDPFVQAFDNRDSRYLWFGVSVYGSLIFQNPVFVAGVWMLWTGELRSFLFFVRQTMETASHTHFLFFLGVTADDKRIYPIMAAYGILGTSFFSLSPNYVDYLLQLSLVSLS